MPNPWSEFRRVRREADVKRDRPYRSCEQLIGSLILVPIVGMFAVAILTHPNPDPFTSVLKIIVLIGIVVLVCFLMWSLWSYRQLGGLGQAQHMTDRRRRRQVQEVPDPVDPMTKHLKHGDIPQLGQDGEIYFKKKPKHTEQSQNE